MPESGNDLKCQFCGTTVIVPEELRAPQPMEPAKIEVVLPHVDEPNLEAAVKPVLLATGGIVGISFLAPLVLTAVILCFVGGIMAVVFGFVGTITTAVNQPAFPTTLAVLQTVSAVATTARSGSTPPPQPSPAASRTPTGTPAPSPTPFTKVLLQDDFSNPKSGWDTGTFDLNTLDYVPGGYHILIGKDNSGESVWLSRNYGDVTVEVDAKSIGAVNDGWMGVLCRAQKEVGSYVFEVTSTGRFQIVKYRYSAQGNRSTTLMRGDLSSGPFKAGTAAHLRADCIGSNLSLWVDGRAIGSIKDSEFTTGGIGLAADTGASGKPGVDILFSSYIVRGP